MDQPPNSMKPTSLMTGAELLEHFRERPDATDVAEKAYRRGRRGRET